MTWGTQHALNTAWIWGAQEGEAPRGSPFLSLPCSKEKEERKLETIALCIVSCQKDKTVLGAHKGPLRPATLSLEGSPPFATPLPSPASSGTTPEGVKHEEGTVTHSDTPSDTPVQTHRNHLGLCAARSPPLVRACPTWCLESRRMCPGGLGQDSISLFKFPSGTSKD